MKVHNEEKEAEERANTWMRGGIKGKLTAALKGGGSKKERGIRD